MTPEEVVEAAFPWEQCDPKAAAAKLWVAHGPHNYSAVLTAANHYAYAMGGPTFQNPPPVD